MGIVAIGSSIALKLEAVIARRSSDCCLQHWSCQCLLCINSCKYKGAWITSPTLTAMPNRDDRAISHFRHGVARTGKLIHDATPQSLSFWSLGHNNMPFSELAIAIILALFLSIGCKEKPKAVESKDKDEGRQNSKVLEAVDLVGYDGKRLRKTTDGVRHANDKRNQDIQRTIDNE